MDIRKIILEEVNDFDWAEDIPMSSEPLTEENAYTGIVVKIQMYSSYYIDGLDGDEANPIDITGKIIGISEDDDFPIAVLWSNDRQNSYGYSDLIIIHHE